MMWLGQNFGYKIHLLYGLTAAPSEKATDSERQPRGYNVVVGG